jgi:hypothetical protein
MELRRVSVRVPSIDISVERGGAVSSSCYEFDERVVRAESRSRPGCRECPGTPAGSRHVLGVRELITRTLQAVADRVARLGGWRESIRTRGLTSFFRDHGGFRGTVIAELNKIEGLGTGGSLLS